MNDEAVSALIILEGQIAPSDRDGPPQREPAPMPDSFMQLPAAAAAAGDSPLGR